MRLVIRKGTGIRMNPSYKSEEQNKGRCMHRNPSYKLSESNELDKESAQSVEYGTGVFSTESLEKTELADISNIDACTKPN